MKRSHHKITAVIQTYSNLYNKIPECVVQTSISKNPTKFSLDHKLTFWTHTINSWACYPQIKTTCMQMTAYLTFFGIGFIFLCIPHGAQQRDDSHCHVQLLVCSQGAESSDVHQQRAVAESSAHTCSLPGNMGCVYRWWINTAEILRLIIPHPGFWITKYSLFVQ